MEKTENFFYDRRDGFSLSLLVTSGNKWVTFARRRYISDGIELQTVKVAKDDFEKYWTPVSLQWQGMQKLQTRMKCLKMMLRKADYGNLKHNNLYKKIRDEIKSLKQN
tara:strand:+ start:971 stop:1294 length:324 start_codon:yes stop_codon:yes gene_type:complete